MIAIEYTPDVIRVVANEPIRNGQEILNNYGTTHAKNDIAPCFSLLLSRKPR